MMSKHKIIVADVLKGLRKLPDESVQCVVTSPPYFGLRDYGTAKWEGGDPACDHTVRADPHTESSTLDGGKATTGHQKEGFKATCPRCGAVRVDSQIGLEQSPEVYVASLVEVFKEMRRVLRKDGIVWLNLGDSYAATPTGNRGTKSGLAGAGSPVYEATLDRYAETKSRRPTIPVGLKPKDLIGIPWRVAFALQADGWWLRSDIVWAKPNPMPESVTDRPTRSHEYIFLLTKSSKYYYDAEAIKEPVAESSIKRVNQKTFDQQTGGEKDYGPNSNRSMRKTVENFAASIKKQDAVGNPTYTGFNERYFSQAEHGPTRNKRDVWFVSTKPYKGSHFATFPPDLIEPCVLAGAPVGGVVLDPFGGAGTVMLVCDRTGRDSIYIDLNPEYAKMAVERLKQDRAKRKKVLTA
jgi:DNA modification methylase